MLGCGKMSWAWIANTRDHFSDQVGIVDLVDLNAESAARRAAEFSYPEHGDGGVGNSQRTERRSPSLRSINEDEALF
jgi:predicted dehydrogenase